MHQNQLNFPALLAEVRRGSSDAAWLLVESYGEHVIRVVRRKLTRQMRSRFDSADFAQMVWASFFSIVGELDQLDEPRDLIRVLAEIARNKTIDEFRRCHQTAKRDIGRDVSLTDAEAAINHVATRRRDTPSGFAIARERWERMMANHPNHYRDMLTLRFEGHTYEQIADRVGTSTRTVMRALAQMGGEPSSKAS